MAEITITMHSVCYQMQGTAYSFQESLCDYFRYLT